MSPPSSCSATSPSRASCSRQRSSGSPRGSASTTPPTTPQFNGVALLGGAGTLHVQVGLDGTASSQIGFDTVDASSAALGLGGVSVATAGDAQAALASLAAAATSVSRSRGGFGAAES